MKEDINILDIKNFDEQTKKGNWIIDFWAEWCGPCKMMLPEFEKAAQEMKGKVKFGKINVDEVYDLAQRFEVMSIPTMILLKNGKEVDRTIGALQKSEIINISNRTFR